MITYLHNMDIGIFFIFILSFYIVYREVNGDAISNLAAVLAKNIIRKHAKDVKLKRDATFPVPDSNAIEKPCISEGDVEALLGRYALQPEALPWLEAQLACWRGGSQLATPRSRAEALALGALLTAASRNISRTDMRDALYVGVQSINSNADKGTTLDDRPLSEVGYDLWESGGWGRCGALLADGRLLRHPCSVPLAYACEEPLRTHPVALQRSSAGDATALSGYTAVPGVLGGLRLYDFPRLPWNVALRRCEKEGGSLAVPRSDREAGLFAGILFSEVQDQSVREQGCFVGINDIAREGNWKTTNGGCFYSKALESKNRRTHNCGVLLVDGTYADAACSDPMPFCCALRYDETDSSAFGVGCSCGAGEVVTREAFTLHTCPLPWFAAQRVCQRGGGVLAVANTLADERLLGDMVRASESARACSGGDGGARDEARAHVGVHRLSRNDTWTTLWGETFISKDVNDYSYHSFSKFPTNTIKVNEIDGWDCGYINESGEYMNSRCSALLPFICQAI